MQQLCVKSIVPACLLLVMGLLAGPAAAQPVQPGVPPDSASGAPAAQPAPDPMSPQPGLAPVPQPPPQPPAPAQDQPAASPPVPDTWNPGMSPQPADKVVTAPAPRPAVDDGPLHMPILFTTPTGNLLPAGMILSETGVDTGGGISSDIRVGLGDVAEFGLGTNALVTVRRDDNNESQALGAYPTALFKMGISENLLLRHQPALSLGFRKSFEREHDGRKTRVAQLYLVASKSLGKRFRLHAGGVLWDGSSECTDGTDRNPCRAGDEVLLHESGVGKQLRPFGGIEIEPLPRSQILLELNWAPEFILSNDAQEEGIALKPAFSWGVRYELADWVMIESGVRIPDIQNVNLIDAQIFGQARFVTRRFRRLLLGLD